MNVDDELERERERHENRRCVDDYDSIQIDREIESLSHNADEESDNESNDENETRQNKNG